MATNYIDKMVGRDELSSLREIALAEEQSFFRRNPHLIGPYRDRLIGVALCQGAALQYVGGGKGVKDFDVHFFYRQNPAKRRLSRPVKRIICAVGQFPRLPVDFIRTVIPMHVESGSACPARIIRAFLRTRPTKNARHLAEKPVVGLYPKRIFAVVLWPPQVS
jgi:hypothetical protein